MEKQCFKCGLVKSLSEFYKHDRMADGHVNKCKECNKVDVRSNRMDKVEQYRDYDKNRGNCGERIKRNAVYNKKYRESFPEKYKAHTAVGNAVRSGFLIKPEICPSCGEITRSKEMHGHHKDYSYPLDVDWLCVRCHAKSHPRGDWY